MEWVNLVINGLAVLLGAVGGSFGTWIVLLYKEKNTQQMASND